MVSSLLFFSFSDEAGFDHKAHNIVFLKHPALSRRPHLTRPPLLSLLYVVENISINIKECFVFFSRPMKLDFQSDEVDMFTL